MKKSSPESAATTPKFESFSIPSAEGLKNAAYQQMPDVFEKQGDFDPLLALQTVLNRFGPNSPVQIFRGKYSEKPISVELLNPEEVEFPNDRMEIWENSAETQYEIKREEKPLETNILSITLGPDFSLQHVPELLRELRKQSEHVADNKNSAEKIDLFTEALERMAAFYHLYGEKLQEIADRNETPEIAQLHLQTYAKVLQTIGADFSEETSDGFQPSKEASEWVNDVFAKNVDEIFTRMFARLSKKETFNWQHFFDTFNNHFVGIIRTELEQNLTDAFFTHAKSEYWRHSDTLDHFKAHMGIFNFQESLGGKYPVEWTNLNTLKADYAEARNSAEKSEIEIRVADALTAMVLHSGFWEFEATATDLAQAAEYKTLDSVNINEIIHRGMKYFLGKETWGVVSSRNNFSALPLSDGRVLAISGEPPFILEDVEKTNKIQFPAHPDLDWIAFGPHEKIQEANIWLNNALDFYNDGDSLSAEFCLRYAKKKSPHDLVIQYYLADHLFRHGDQMEAELIFRDILRACPNYHQARAAYAELIRAQGGLDEALEMIEAARALDPNNANYKQISAEILLDKGKWDEGLTEYKEAANLAETEPTIVMSYAEALYEDNQLEKAAENIKSFIENPANKPLAEAHNLYGRILSELGDRPAAEREMEMALKLKPGFDLFWDDLIQFHQSAGDYPAAERKYLEALATFPEHAAFHNNYGLLLHRQDFYDEADKFLTQAVTLQPNDPNMHLNLANNEAKLQRKKSAENHYLEAVRLAPTVPSFLIDLAWFYVDEGDNEKAKEYFQKAVTKTNHDINYLKSYASFLEDEGEYDQVSALYETHIELHGNSAELQNNLGILYFKQKKYDESEAAMLEAFVLNPSEITYLDNYGEFLLQRGDVDHADQKIADLLAQFPRNLNLKNAHARLLLKQGKLREGYQQMLQNFNIARTDLKTLLYFASFYDDGEFSSFKQYLNPAKKAEYEELYRSPKNALHFYNLILQLRSKVPHEMAEEIDPAHIESRIDALEKEVKSQAVDQSQLAV